MMAFVYYVLTKVLLGSNIPNDQFLLIYISVVFWRWMSKAVDGSPTIFASYATILKQTNFSVFSLILSSIGVETVAFLIASVVLFIFCAMLGFYPRFSYVYLIVPMIAQLSIIMCLTAFFATLGAFVRDLQGFLSSATGIWFYMSPGIYPLERVSPDYLWLFYLNPFAHILPAYQMIIREGKVPEFGPLILIAMVGVVLTFGAMWLLKRARRHFFSYI
jgi:lipopolysaccharide transport system permease protein